MSLETRILIIEDEPSIADTLIYTLEKEHFTCQWEALGVLALQRLTQFDPNLILLDVGLPDMSGFELCQSLRRMSPCPIIFLTARSDEIDKVLGFELGADDYVTKPFSPREVISRVRAVLRRCQASTQQSNDIEFMPKDIKTYGPFTLSETTRTITYFDQALELTRYEFGILSLLIQQPGRIYSRDQLMESVWMSPHSSIDRVIDTHIKTIRAKLRAIKPDQSIVHTHRGIGYSIKWHNHES